MITICEVFLTFSYYHSILLLLVDYVFLVHQIVTKTKETRTQDVGFLPGSKLLTL